MSIPSRIAPFYTVLSEIKNLRRDNETLKRFILFECEPMLGFVFVHEWCDDVEKWQYTESMGVDMVAERRKSLNWLDCSVFGDE